MSTESQVDQIFDIIGCGFGPANLAIAAALTDKWAETEVRFFLLNFLLGCTYHQRHLLTILGVAAQD